MVSLPCWLRRGCLPPPQVFQNVVGQKELAKLDGLGLAYRVPPPGAVLRGPTLLAAGLPGLRLEYREDGARGPAGTNPPVGGRGEGLQISQD